MVEMGAIKNSLIVRLGGLLLWLGTFGSVVISGTKKIKPKPVNKNLTENAKYKLALTPEEQRKVQEKPKSFAELLSLNKEEEAIFLDKLIESFEMTYHFLTIESEAQARVTKELEAEVAAEKVKAAHLDKEIADQKEGLATMRNRWKEQLVTEEKSLLAQKEAAEQRLAEQKKALAEQEENQKKERTELKERFKKELAEQDERIRKELAEQDERISSEREARKKSLAEKDQQIASERETRKKSLAEKDQQIASEREARKKSLAEKDQQISEKDREIEQLTKRLERMRRRPGSTR